MSTSPSVVVLDPVERLDRLIQQVRTRGRGTVVAGNPFLWDLALYRASRGSPQDLGRMRSRGQIRAAMVMELAALAPIVFPADWTLAGEQVRFAPDYGVDRAPERALECLTALGLSAAEVPLVALAVQAWRSARATTGDVEDLWSEGRGEWGDGATSTVFSAAGWIENHSIRGYERLLSTGFRGLIQQIDAAQAAADPEDPATAGKLAVWASLRTVAEAGILLATRYAQAARVQAQAASDPAEQARLIGMAEVLDRVPEHPCRTDEAAASRWRIPCRPIQAATARA